MKFIEREHTFIQSFYRKRKNTTIPRCSEPLDVPKHMIIAQTYISVLPLCTFYLFKFTFKIMRNSLFIKGMINIEID